MSAVETEERRLGRYDLIAPLGQGGMANVYLAVVAGPASFNKLLVLKALRPDLPPELVQMFLNEARLLARFNHPNIVQAYEVSESAERYFIALEYLDGQPLHKVKLKLNGAFPLAEELRVLAEVARGLHYVHELKDFDGSPLHVVHRDVSPHNVFLTYDGRVKLLDFGISKTASAAHFTLAGQIKGHLGYLAPEQARGDAVDRRADIFALGVMVWEAVTRRSFSGGVAMADAARLHQRLIGGEPDVLEIRSDVPEPLVALIRRSLRVDPGLRPRTALEFATTLESFLEAQGWAASARSLSQHLSGPFAEERAKLSARIQERLKRLHQGSDESLSSSPLETPHALIVPARPTTVQVAAPSSQPATSLVVTAGSLPPAPRVRFRRSDLAKLAVGGVVVLLAAILAGRDARPSPPPAPPPAPTRVALPTPAPLAPQGSAPVVSVAPAQPQRAGPAKELVTIDVQVSPPDAVVELDGAALPILPFHAELRRDARIHQLEAKADGYETKRIVLPFDQDRDLRVVLDRKAQSQEVVMEKRPREEARHGEPRASAPSTPSTTDAKAERPAAGEPGSSLVSRRRSGLRLDKANPYAD